MPADAYLCIGINNLSILLIEPLTSISVMHPQHVSTIWIKMLVAMGGLLLTLVIKENDGDDKPIVHFLPTNISWSFY